MQTEVREKNADTVLPPPKTTALAAIRDATSDEEFAIMRNFYMNTLKLLTCAFCNRERIPDYHVCRLCAQCVCVSCFRQLFHVSFSCPACKEGTYNLNAVNEKYGGATERVLRLLSAEWGMKCTFAGCGFVSTQRDIIAHSNTCKYKPFACPILFCASTEVNIVTKDG